jgi:PQ loop repeat.
MEALGWAGTALVVVAYYPQIHHLYFERCAWGISVLTWLIWLAASLLLTYCILRGQLLMGFLQGVNIAAITTTIILVRRSKRICSYHRKDVETSARQSDKMRHV